MRPVTRLRLVKVEDRGKAFVMDQREHDQRARTDPRPGGTIRRIAGPGVGMAIVDDDRVPRAQIVEQPGAQRAQRTGIAGQAR